MDRIGKMTPANSDQEQFYQDVVHGFKRACKKHPKMRNMEIIAVTGRLIGYCIAMCFENERDLARKTAIINMDVAVEQVGMTGPTAQGPEGHA
jgi:hypothetical protein